MKRLISLVLVALLFLTTACSEQQETEPPQEILKENHQVDKLVTAYYDRIEFEGIAEKVHTGETAQQFFHVFRTNPNEGMIVIAWDAMGSGGFDLAIKSIQNEDKKTIITVDEISPKDEDPVTTAFTFPRLKEHLTDIKDKVIVQNTEGKRYTEQYPDYDKLLDYYKETHLYEYQTHDRIAQLQQPFKNLKQNLSLDIDRSNYFMLAPGYKDFKGLRLTFVKDSGKIQKEDVEYIMQILPENSEGYSIDLMERDSKFKFGDSRDNDYENVHYKRSMGLYSMENKHFTRCQSRQDDYNKICRELGIE